MNKALGSTGAFSQEGHINMLKEFASVVSFSCHGEGHMASLKELSAAAAVLQRDLKVLKKRTLSFMVIILVAALSLQAVLGLLSRYHDTKKRKLIKYKAKLRSIQDQKQLNKQKALELKKSAAELRAKGASHK